MVRLPGGVLHELRGVGHGVYYHVQRVPQTNTKQEQDQEQERSPDYTKGQL